MTDLNELLERVKSNRVKALSIKQPYPHLIFHKGKDVENRDWATRGRGWFLVHAGVSKSEIDKGDPEEADLPRGGIVGFARIVDCVTEMDSGWFYGKYGFVLRDAHPVPLIPCKGQLGFFSVDESVSDQAAAHIAALISKESQS